ncbi:MAG: TolB family protein [Gammaproteobacteria bacterium]
MSILGLALPGPATAQAIDLSELETEDLRLLYFDPQQTYLAPHAARSFHNSLRFQKEVLDWVPWDKTTVLLKDFSDYGNAAARAAPNNALLIDIAPISGTFETFTASERMYTLMNHELVHVATMDMWNEQDRRWRRFFGGKVTPITEHPESILYAYLTAPRTAVPRWYLEGSAVFMETWMAGGLGRAQGAYDEMVFRAMVRDDAYFYDALGLVSEGTQVDFQVGVNAYLYGTRFMSYLALVYSPQHVLEWLQRNEGSERYYARQFEHVFGKPLTAAWQDWIAWEHEFQRENLESVRRFPTTIHQNLTARPLGSVSRAYVDPETRTLYGAFRYPGVVAHIGALSLDTGRIRRLTDIKGPMLYRVSSVAFDPTAGTVFYTADNYAFRDLMAVDVKTRKRRMLLKDARIGDVVFNTADRSLWGVRHLNGYATLVRIPYPYEEWNQIHTWPYGETLYDMDISPDGSLLSTSMGEINGNQSLQVFRIEDLLAGSSESIAKFDFGTATPEGFVFSPDGCYLYGSSYFTGVSNIFRYEIANGELEAVSNAESGYFRPIPLEDGSLIVFHYTGQGFRPASIDPEPLEDVSAITFLGARIAREHPIVTEWQVGSPADVPLDSMITHQGPYRIVREVGLQAAYPVLEGYKDSAALGWHFNFQDRIGFDHLDATASYSPDGELASDERAHVAIDYRHNNWNAGFRYNGADFYDLFGPTKRSRKGYAYTVGYERALIYDTPRQLDFVADAAYYDGLERLPDFQNIEAAFDELLSVEAGFYYQHPRASLGHVDDEKGVLWDLVASGDHVNGETIPKLRGAFDFGFALPLRHSSIWLRNDAGFADGDRSDPFANFFFGGFGNNYVDNREAKRYREWYSFPGFKLNEIGGTRYAKSLLEWNLPPVRFRQVGTPGFYLSWARPALFYGALTTEPDRSRFRRTVTSFGVQIDLQFRVVHRLDMMLSAGYALGFEDGDRMGDEFMISLKVL